MLNLTTINLIRNYGAAWFLLLLFTFPGLKKFGKTPSDVSPDVKVDNIFFSYMFLVLKDSNGHWPDDGSIENTTPPVLPSGAAWYI